MAEGFDPAKNILNQSESLGLIAHEIKSPIAATIQLLQALEMILSKPEDEQARRLVKRAIKRSSSALDLTRNLLEYIKVNQTTPEKSRSQHLVLSEHLPVLLEKHIHFAESKNVRIICEFASQGTPVAVMEFEFRLIADNLISNAIRYSKRSSGDQRVWIRTFEVQDSVIFQVEDEGIGMSDEDRKKVFEGFYRSSMAKEQTISGSGLGMSIVKQIIDKMGASIICRSQPGQGTAFTVKFPKA